MSAEYGAGLLVGAFGPDILKNAKIPKKYVEDGGLFDWLLDEGMTNLSTKYNSSEDVCYFGFQVENVRIKDIDAWTANVKELGRKFEELTNTEANLICSIDIS